MFRDGKKQAGGRGLFVPLVNDTMPELSRAPSGFIAANSIEVSPTAKTVRLN
jgi:hypothetical protein